MKTLHNHIILYDAECPMCNLYTGAFVRNGLLETDGREAYQQYAGAACPNLDWQRAWDYLGNLTTISLAGALALLGFMAIGALCNPGWLICALFFMLVVSLMFLEHLRRSRLLGIGYLPSATWVLYRVIILIILLQHLP